MKKTSLFAAFIFTATFAFSQNIGIGTSTPTYPLTVASVLNKGIVQTAGTVELGFYTSSGGTAYVQTWSNHNLNFATNNSLPQMTIATNGNVGIGATAPTAKLDINGSVRIRGGSPVAGDVLTAIDASGNAEWQAPGAGTVKILNVHYSAFTPTTSAQGWTDAALIARRPSAVISGTTSFVAPLLIPKGSTITGIDWLFIDNDASKDFSFELKADDNYSTSNPGNGVIVISSATSTGASNAARLVNDPVSNFVTDNTTYFLSFSVTDWPTVATMGVKGVRVYYK